MLKILLIEDDTALANTIKKGLEKKDYYVTVVLDGIKGRIEDWDKYDLIIVDWNLPYVDGVDLIRQKRHNNWQGLCLMLTARAENVDLAFALDYGADDYMSKPFEWEVLYARVGSLLRRKTGFFVENLDSIKWDQHLKQFSEDNEDINLSSTEYSILIIFFQNPKKIFTRDQLIEHIYGKNWDLPESNVIDRHIAAIRKKFKYDPIKTIHGSGYRLRLNTTNQKDKS
jgi:DNA-binding response OmpR family regulator